MELTSVLKNELFRPTVTLIIPGGIATAPYLSLCFHYFPCTKKFASSNTWLFAIVILLVSVAIGLILEDIGSRIEACFDEKLARQKKYTRHVGEWKKYWRLSFKEESVGHRYLRSIIIRLKFEMNMIASLPFLFFGFLWLSILKVLTATQMFVIGVIVAALLSYMTFEAWAGVKLLSDIRRELLKGVVEPPIRDARTAKGKSKKRLQDQETFAWQ